MIKLSNIKNYIIPIIISILLGGFLMFTLGCSSYKIQEYSKDDKELNEYYNTLVFLSYVGAKEPKLYNEIIKETIKGREDSLKRKDSMIRFDKCIFQAFGEEKMDYTDLAKVRDFTLCLQQIKTSY